MQFPFKPKHLVTAFGSTVLEITGIRHELDKPKDGYSRDYWLYDGRVRYEDSGKEMIATIEPSRLCYDNSEEGRLELNELSGAMMEYLRQHGEWCDRKSKHEGWYAHRTKERSAA